MFRALTILSTFSSFFTPLRASTIYPTFNLGNVNGVSGSVFTGKSNDDQSGTSVTSMDDFNGDGKADFATGAPNAGSNSNGQVSVVYGSDIFNPVVDLSTLDGNNGFLIIGNPNAKIGSALASGDFNGDGLSDLAIGAYNAAKVYLIYGSLVGFNATFPLAALGTKGFVVYGQSTVDYTGYSVTIARNFNGNGFGALAVGAPYAGLNSIGLVAVVFGTNKTISAVNISALNGTNGFIIPGIFSHGQSGPVASGDINGDGLGDLVVGTPYAASNGQSGAGLVVVVFGANKTVTAVLNVSLLNGPDGFSMAGVSGNDALGYSVGTYDINNDGVDDLLMGAPVASPGGRVNAGSLFVLLGRLHFNATVDLAKLNGTDGYRINGPLTGDSIGSTPVKGGRINGDGFGDLIIGVPNTSPGGLYQAGSTFVVFGTNKSLSAVLELPGSNAQVLRIDGHLANMNSGSCVGSADVYGDGYGLSALIIGANMASPGNALNGGSTYVVRGDSIQLANNQLTIPAGGSHILMPSDLNAFVPHNPEYTQYTITGIQHVQFEYTDQSGVAITSFSGQDIIRGRVNVTHDNSELAPSYLVTTLHTLAGTTAYPANVTFINQLPVLVNNSLIINQGQTIKLGASNLAAVDPDNVQNNAGIIFTISDSSNGFPSTFTFSQSQLWNGGVYFIQDNSINAPQYEVSISRGGVTIGPVSAVVDFDTIPALDQNHFDICQGETKTVTSTMLSAIHPGANSSDALVFSVKYVQYGYFKDVNAADVAILSFTQAEIQNSSVLFVHDGSPNPHSFMVTVSDGRVTTPLTSAAPYFTYAPVLTRSTLALNQGQTTILNSNMLDAVDPNLNSLSEDLIFTVSNVEGGAFVEVNATRKNISISQFTRRQVSANAIAFESNGSSNIPSCDVSVANRCSETPPSGAAINYNYIPSFTANQLTITDGESVILTSAQLAAIDLGQGTSPGNLVFTVSGVENGYFDATTLPGTQIYVFSQQRVFNGEIRFVPKSSSLQPAYNVTVSDGVLLNGPQEALVTLKHTPSATVFDSSNSNTVSDTIRNSLIAFFSVTVPFGLLFWLGKRYADKRMNNKLETLLKLEHSSVEKADEAWKNNTVFPVLKEVFSRIQTATGRCGYRDEQTTRGYIQGIEKLLGKLKELGVNINLNELPDHERNGFKSAIADEVQKRAEWGKPPRSAFSKGCATLLSASSGPVFTASDFQKTALQIAEVIATTYKQELEENYIDRFRRSVYDEYPTRPEVKRKRKHSDDIELVSFGENSDEEVTEQKFASKETRRLAIRITQLGEGLEKLKEQLKEQQEQTARSSGGPFVGVGARRASEENSPKPGDTTVVTVAKPEKVRVAA